MVLDFIKNLPYTLPIHTTHIMCTATLSRESLITFNKSKKKAVGGFDEGTGQTFFQELSTVLGQECVSIRKTIGASVQHTGG